MIAIRMLPLLLLSLALAAEAGTGTVTIPAARDATLVEHAEGAFANGSGPALFAGRTGQATDSIRRTLLAFDVASHLPRRARVMAARLMVYVEPGNASPEPLRLHRVLSAWSEGPSSAAGGRGAPSQPGDATWIHAVLPDARWSVPGGDFAAAPVAEAVPPASGSLAFGSTPGLVADVQLWLEQPERDHGWLLAGAEDAPSTSQRLASREHPDPARRPVLVVDFERRDGVCSEADLSPAAFGLCDAYCEALDCDASTSRASGRACEALASAFARRTGEPRLPCELPDRDADGVPDDVDLCPDTPDAGQEDTDEDGVGDACDNCPTVANADQKDTFGAMGIGDACDCPCFTDVEATGLAMTLQDTDVYRDLSCVDTRIGVKPLTALRALRVDGSDCGAASQDCSALAVEFTEDRACAWNPPAPALPVTIQGIRDPQREACRAAIRVGAAAAGLSCN